MLRADKYSKQRIDKLKELYINHPDYLMQDLAEEMGLNVSDVFIDIVGEIPVVLTTGGIALTCKLVRACFFTLAYSLVYFTNYLCYNS